MLITHKHRSDVHRFYHVLSADERIAYVAPLSKDGVQIGDAHDVLLENLVRVKQVEGLFGQPKFVDRVEFQNRWAAVVNELYWLTDSTAEFEEIKGVKERVHQLAGAKWDKIAG